MKSYVLTFVIAACTSALLTPIVRKIALMLGAVSVPGGRNIHQRAIPRLGGIALFVAFFTPLAALFFIESSVAHVFRTQVVHTVGLLAGGSVLCLLGALDDVRRVRALHKLLVQIAIAILAYACGFQIDIVKIPGLHELSMGIFSLPVTVLWIVGVVNAINLVDGLDGLAGGVVFFAGITNFCVASLSNTVIVALFMSAMSGAVFAFLFYNFNPARIFMGDSGSYFLGYVLATTSLLGSMQRTSTAVSLLVPILALGVPIFDTLFSIVRRFLERRPLFSPDRGHLHHRLLDMGLTHRRAVLILYGASIVFTVTAVLASLGKSWQVGLAILVASVVLIGLVRFAGYFEYLHLINRQKARVHTADVERLRRLIPQLPQLFSAVHSEADLWGALTETIRRADIQVAEVLTPADSKGEPLLRLTTRGVDMAHEQELLTARYPLGREDNARATLKFLWESDFADVSPQTDILLQIVADTVEAHLCRLGSELGPVVQPADEAVEAALDAHGSVETTSAQHSVGQ